MKISYMILAALFLVSAASAASYSKEVRCDFTYYEAGAELRVECPGVAKFLDCNNSCFTKFNVTGSVAESVCNTSGIEYGLHSAITQARDKVLAACNNSAAPKASCNCTFNPNLVLGPQLDYEKDTRSLLSDKIMNIVDCRNLKEDLDACENRYKFLVKDLGISQNQTRDAVDDLGRVTKERNQAQDYFNYMALITIASVAWATGLIDYLRRKWR